MIRFFIDKEPIEYMRVDYQYNVVPRVGDIIYLVDSGPYCVKHVEHVYFDEAESDTCVFAETATDEEMKYVVG